MHRLPLILPPGSAPGLKLVPDKNDQKSLEFFSHLAPLILFFFTKRQIQKGGGGGGAWSNAPPPTFAPAFDHTYYTGADPESFGGEGV